MEKGCAPLSLGGSTGVSLDFEEAIHAQSAHSALLCTAASTGVKTNHKVGSQGKEAGSQRFEL